MRPTFDMISYQLANIWNIHTYINTETSIRLSVPKLYDVSSSFHRNQCIIADAYTLPKNASVMQCPYIICCNGEPPAIYKKDTYALIVIDPSVPITKVLNQVQEIYLLYQEWEETLNELLGNNVDIQEILNLSSPVLGNLLTLTDENHNLMASSSHGHYEELSESMISKQHSIMEDTKVTLLHHDRIHIGDRFYDYDLYELSSDAKTPEIYSLQFLSEKKPIATLSMVSTEHPLAKHDQQLLETLASYVLVQLLRPSELEDHHKQNVFLDLLKGTSVSEADIKTLEILLHDEPDDLLCCIVLKLPKDLTSESGTYLRRRMKLLAMYSFSVIYDNHLVAVVNTSKCNWNETNFFSSIQDCLGQLKFTVGISDPFHEIADLHSYFQEAKNMTAFSSKSSSRILHMEECWYPYVFTHCRNGLPAEMLYPSGLKRLIAYDKNSSVDYLETLQIYLEEGRNDSKTAARLFISRNSFLYRLEKIKQILENDLADPDVRFQLEFALRLYKMTSK